jgi:acyl-CoA synthetase (AMP-forming)/AMP-acid ligase II
MSLPAASLGRSTDLLDLLEAAASGRGAVRFLPDNAAPVPFHRLWRRSGAAARWLRGRMGTSGNIGPAPAGRVGAVLTASPDCLGVLVGAWRIGLGVVSLPLPSRGMSTANYGQLLDRCCAAAGVELVLTERAYRLPLRIPLHAYEACVRDGRDPDRVSGGDLVQFTSGSTGNPKGVQLSLDAIAANIVAILGALAPDPDDYACSWLPIAHDMGLIGMCMTAWVATGRSRTGRGGLCLIRTEAFAADPGLWLRACAELGATYTAAPTFGYALATRVAGRGTRLDLSRLRACIVGAELVRADVLRRFAAATRAARFDPVAFCPAYGLAEAAVAVTVQPRDVRWSALELDDRELVSCGPPLPGVEVRINSAPSSADGAGGIEIRSPSLLTGYLPAGGPPPVSADGWLATGDLGYLINGQLHVAGRADDVLIVRGRNIIAAEVDAVVADHLGVHAGAVSVVGTRSGGYTVVLEVHARPARYHRLGLDLDGHLVEQLGVGPQSIVLVTPGTLPKTANGKVARHQVQTLLRTGGLAAVASLEVRPDRGGCDD